MHSPEKMLQIAKVEYLQIVGNVDTISSRTTVIPLIRTILNSNKTTNSSELLKADGNTLAVIFLLAPAMLPHPGTICSSLRKVTAFLRSSCWTALLICPTYFIPNELDKQRRSTQLKLVQLIWMRTQTWTDQRAYQKGHYSLGKIVINNWKQTNSSNLKEQY